jgi:hypothetical protein
VRSVFAAAYQTNFPACCGLETRVAPWNLRSGAHDRAFF